MNGTQLYFAVGLPCLTVIASLVLSMFTMSGVREDIREIRGHLRTIVEKLGAMDVEIAKLMDKKG
jgi:hypothetical protein